MKEKHGTKLISRQLKAEICFVEIKLLHVIDIMIGVYTIFRCKLLQKNSSFINHFLLLTAKSWFFL